MMCKKTSTQCFLSVLLCLLDDWSKGPPEGMDVDMSTLNMDAVPDGWDWSQGPPPEIFMDAPPSSENGESPGETSAQEVETSTQGANPCKKPAAQQKPPDWVVEQFGLDGTESQEDAPAWVQDMFIDNEEPCVEVEEASSTVVEEDDPGETAPDDPDDGTVVSGVDSTGVEVETSTQSNESEGVEVETSTQSTNPCKPAAQQKPPDWVVEQFGLDGTESQEDAPAWVQAMFIDNEDSVQEPCVEVEAPSTVVEEEDDTDDSTMVIEESDNWFISMMCGLLGIMCGDS